MSATDSTSATPAFLDWAPGTAPAQAGVTQAKAAETPKSDKPQAKPADGFDTAAAPKVPTQVKKPAKVDPLHVPQAMTDYMSTLAWGVRHLAWHTSRQWSSVATDTATLAWFTRHGIKLTAAAIQEGQTGNGIEFGAMHSGMVAILTKQFGQPFVDMLNAWPRIPTDPNDKNWPIPGAKKPYDPAHLTDLNSIVNLDGSYNDVELAKWKTGERSFTDINGKKVSGLDGFAMFVEEGIHNYTHNRFTDSKSKISMGDPTVNINNKTFWALHGFIDRAFKHYLEKFATPDETKTYQDSVTAQTSMMLQTPEQSDKLSMKDMPGCTMGSAQVKLYDAALNDSKDPLPARLHNFWSPPVHHKAATKKH